MAQLESSVRILADDDGAVLLNANTGECFSLNSVGAFIMQRLESGAEREELISALQNKFPGVGLDTLRRDADIFLKSLIENGVLQDVSS